MDKFPLIFIMVCVFTACTGSKNMREKKRLDAWLSERQTMNRPDSVHRFTWEGGKGYLVTYPCCDRPEEIFDGDFNYLCAPWGGISGQGNGKCSETMRAGKNGELLFSGKQGD
jgi:hypothetical protein